MKMIMNLVTIIFLFGNALLLHALENIEAYDALKNVYEQTPKIDKTAQVWKAQLTPIQYHVTREQGTERAYTGMYHDNHKQGLYKCIGCGLDLFNSKDKFESGTGWPSFTRPVDKANITYVSDNSAFMERIEVKCPRCNAHLGHVFDDGPKPTGKRYCINSASLQFIERK